MWGVGVGVGVGVDLVCYAVMISYVCVALLQALQKTQATVAAALKMPQNRVFAKVKRVGGGFGGKESRTVLYATATAIAAKLLNQPVRLLMERDVDMLVTGQVC